MKVAIQGGKASFHDIATHRFFSKESQIQLFENDTFRGACKDVYSDRVDYGLIVIENSIAGSILPNYSLIEEYNLHIVGEYKLRIKQNLMALPGQQLKDIQLVRSHYMALLQCNEYLNQYPEMVLEEAADTADSAKDIRENNRKGVAAIASDKAAQLYDLEILGESIETNKLNFTRFFVLSKKQKHYYPRKELNKATLSFELSHEVGSLARALQIIVEKQINLTKIQSIPIVGKPDQYTFFIDCVWENYADIIACYKQLEKLLVNLKLLGEYKHFEIDYDHTISG